MLAREASPGRMSHLLPSCRHGVGEASSEPVIAAGPAPGLAGAATRGLLAFVSGSLLLAACAGGGPNDVRTVPPSTSAGGSAGTSTGDGATSGPSSSSGTSTGTAGTGTGGAGTGTGAAGPDAYRPTDADLACAAAIADDLTLAQRVGQLFVIGIRSDTSRTARPTALVVAEKRSVGGYLLYGGTDRGVSGVHGLTAAVEDDLTVEGVRPFVAADQEGGRVQNLRGKGFTEIPTALDQGDRDPDALERSWREDWAPDLVRAGVNVDFAPVADVVPASLGRGNGPIGYYEREYGHTPAAVAGSVGAVVRGLGEAGVIATAKHFPGLGRVRGNTDSATRVTDDRTDPDDPYLRAFAAAVDAGAPMVMVSSARYTKIDPDHRAVFSPEVMDLLRERLGFAGLIVSDDIGAAKQVADVSRADRARRFFAAGGQLAVVVGPPEAVTTMTVAVVEAARDDARVRQQVDAASRAVLALKVHAGLVAQTRCPS